MTTPTTPIAATPTDPARPAFPILRSTFAGLRAEFDLADHVGDYLERHGTVIAATARYPRGERISTALFDVWCPSLAPAAADVALYHAHLRRALRTRRGRTPGAGDVHLWLAARTLAFNYLNTLWSRKTCRVVSYPVEGPRDDATLDLHPLAWLLGETVTCRFHRDTWLERPGPATLLCFEDTQHVETPYCHLDTLFYVARLLWQKLPAPERHKPYASTEAITLDLCRAAISEALDFTMSGHGNVPGWSHPRPAHV